MAEPARKYSPEYDPDPRFAQDPFNPAPPPLSDPARPERVTTDTEDPRTILEERYAAPRSIGSGVVLAAIVVLLALLAFYFFAPGANETAPPPIGQPPATQPAQPTPAPAQ
jgi:hypothetical protein